MGRGPSSPPVTSRTASGPLPPMPGQQPLTLTWTLRHTLAHAPLLRATPGSVEECDQAPPLCRSSPSSCPPGRPLAPGLPRPPHWAPSLQGFLPWRPKEAGRAGQGLRVIMFSPELARHGSEACGRLVRRARIQAPSAGPAAPRVALRERQALSGPPWLPLCLQTCLF